MLKEIEKYEDERRREMKRISKRIRQLIPKKLEEQLIANNFYTVRCY